MPTYYRIKDKDLICRQDGMFECYLYMHGKGWVFDKDNMLMDRLIGYTSDGVGNSDIMDLVEQLSEAEAVSFIQQQA